MEETEIASNQRKWKPSMDKVKHRLELRHAAATGSLSDPHSSMKSNRNHSSSYSKSRDQDGPSSFGFGLCNNNHNRTTVNQKPMGQTHYLEGSRSSSFTEGFSQPEDDEDEATDILVWNAPKRQSQSNGFQRCHRSLSDSSERQVPSSVSISQTPSLIQKSKKKESLTSRVQVHFTLESFSFFMYL